jgi:putative membrane protein
VSEGATLPGRSRPAGSFPPVRAEDSGSSTPPVPTDRLTAAPGNVLRGMAMGVAEVVPGVSGGTVALVLGVYERLIDGAGHVVTALRLSVTGRWAEARAELRRAHWTTIVPLLAGMVVAVLIAARLLEPVIEDHPVGARAVFFGLVLVSIVVPARMVGRWAKQDVATAVLAAVAAFLLTGLPPAGDVDPPLLVVVLAAAVAICALVLPGVSGSFLLLTLGLYQPTLTAVNDRDLGYLGAFALGAALGLGLFVKALQVALRRHHALTLALMTGLMAGSLRALWPWQDEDRSLLAPDGGALPVFALAVGAGLTVVLVLVLQLRHERRTAAAALAAANRLDR